MHLKFLFAFFTLNVNFFGCRGYYSTNSDFEFCYDDSLNCGPSHWGEKCSNGLHQSPIDININLDSDPVENSNFLELSSTYVTSFSRYEMENNGHSLSISFDGDEDNEVERDDATISYERGGKNRYEFAHMHFHWGERDNEGSEHTVNGTSYPMEIHYVHFSRKYEDLEDAVEEEQDPVSLTVIGIFVKICSSANQTSPGFSKIINHVKNVTQYDREIEIKDKLGLSDFMPKNLDYFSYIGSLTTPSCAERVKWTVLNEPICIPSNYLNSFRQLKTKGGKNLTKNFRPTKPVGNREVKFHRVSKVEIFDPFENKTGTLSSIFSRVMILLFIVTLFK